MMKAKSLLVFVLACALLVAGCSAVPPNSDMPEAVPSTGLPSTCTPSAANPPMDYTLYGGDILRVGSQGYEKCRINADTAQKYAGLISDAADALAGETQVYCLIIPTSYGILLPDEVKARLSDYEDTEACISEVYAALSENAKPVRVWDKLKAHSDEFIYFRTDLHWTARGAYLGYEAFCNAKGIAPIPLEAHRSVNFEGFFGTFYSESGGDEKFSPAETIEAFYPVSDGVTLTVTDADDNTTDCPIVADVSELHAIAKYRTFSGGNNPFSVVTNPNITDDSVLILVKESFGNPLPAFLCDHYSTIYIIDYRSWYGNIIDFAREVHADDLLFANNINAVNSGGNVGFIAMKIK